jgi:nucleoside-diphosphate-sugar epimerase
MKCLVTGGSGYFGELLCKMLLEMDHDVYNLDLNENRNEDSRIKYIKADIRDYKKVLQSCEGMDYVFHNVAQVPLAKDNELFRTVNIDGTRNILAASLENEIKKLVYTSSSAIFGVPKSNPVMEKTVPNPMEAYGDAKYQGELLCHEYNKKGLDISIVRPRTILGHGRLGIFQILFEWVYNGQNIPVFSGGKNKYQFVHPEDLAHACVKSVDKSGLQIYNCGAENFGTMKELLQELCDYANTGSRVSSVPTWPAVLGMKATSLLGLSPLGAYHALMYGRSMYFDISKCKQELNWKPKYSNKEMIIQSYKWYVENREFVLRNKSGSHHKTGVKQGILKFVGKLL